jgi:uncharacterized protein YjbJ (UPF0337 family)
MNKDSIVGKAKEIAGTMQESFGKAIHSDKVTAGGQHTQEAGREQSATGAGTHAAKDAPAKVEPKK